jgi:hypothetical protein
MLTRFGEDGICFVYVICDLEVPFASCEISRMTESRLCDKVHNATWAV